MLYYIGNYNTNFLHDTADGVSVLIYDTEDFTLESVNLYDVYKSKISVEGVEFTKDNRGRAIEFVVADLSPNFILGNSWLTNGDIIFATDSWDMDKAYYVNGGMYWSVGENPDCIKVIDARKSYIVLPVGNCLCCVDYLDTCRVRKLRLKGGIPCNTVEVKKKLYLGCSLSEVFD